MCNFDFEFTKTYLPKYIPEDKSAKIIMTTALNEEKNVKKAFELGWGLAQ